MKNWFQTLPKGWQAILNHRLSIKEREKITQSLLGPYSSEKSYPRQEQLFRAFELSPPEQVKVVILGQDPYHGPGQAHGLAFSVPPHQKVPPSLRNIFKELKEDVGESILSSGDLSPWARQGVFLLNCFLSVREQAAGSHRHLGWENLSNAAIAGLSAEKEHLVFILWGNFAQKKKVLINPKKHLVLEAPHPSPLAAHRGFFGSKPFSKANQYLKSQGVEPIQW